jgi:hypothetical protein
MSSPPADTLTGGQWAPGAHSEADMDLGTVSVAQLQLGSARTAWHTPGM